MTDINDVDLEDLIEQSGTSADDLDISSKKELAEKVAALGSVKLDDEGRMLISCPEWRHINTEHICGLFPLPDPDGDGFKQVCTGPTMRLQNGKIKSGTFCPDTCPYNPNRLEKDNNESNEGSGGLF